MDINIQKMMTDSHFHILEMKRKGMDLKEVFKILKDNEAGIVLDAGVSLSNFEERLGWRNSYEDLYFAAGIHPNIPSSEWPDGFRETLKRQVSHPFVKAIGETGLDFFREYSNEEDQFTLLNLHYELSQESGKALIFHIRNAEDAMKKWIKQRDFKTRGVLHCFPGDFELAEIALEKGFYISYAGNVTFKNAGKIRESLNLVPLDRLLVETDAPYLSPHPKRGRENHPGLIGYTYEVIAEEKKVSIEELIQRVDMNLKSFLKLN
ncbi:TatD family hydrolase [Oceanispirochaeta sp.]|jgi:TatD DNase family protein|uniref:TatD family hydrolase n=1 Tax=Oceanispirochaeta sp. TaxID=2035350 RepID=UPI00260A9D86|nr:TatD family hydrolase [Oceanispirochaeta sp.]MDA3958572.1 TatD family hydrolase [Oceanispirochaeta sp.]